MTQPEKEARDALQKLRNQYLSQQIKRLQEQLSRADLTEEQKLATVAEYTRLTMLKRQPLVLPGALNAAAEGA
jgi:hypothetical protein